MILRPIRLLAPLRAAPRTLRLSRRVAVLGGALVALLVLGALLLRPADPHASPAQPGLATVHVGRPAPGFTLLDLQGRTVQLADYRGHAVLLNFWSPTCVPCRTEMPDLQRAWRRLRRVDGPLIVGIDASADSRDAVRRFAARAGVDYPLLLDPYEMASMGAYHVYQIPTSVLIDPRGIVRQIRFGPLTEAQIVQALQPAPAGAG